MRVPSRSKRRAGALLRAVVVMVALSFLVIGLCLLLCDQRRPKGYRLACSRSARRETGRAIDIIDDAHVDDALITVGGKRFFAAYPRDERAQLTGVGGVARYGFLLHSVGRLERDLIALMRSDRV